MITLWLYYPWITQKCWLSNKIMKNCYYTFNCRHWDNCLSVLVITSILMNIFGPGTTHLVKMVGATLNSNLKKMGPGGPQHYIFGDQLYSKNVRILKLHEFLHLYTRKHMISWFHLKWTEFTRNLEFFSNLVWVLEVQ